MSNTQTNVSVGKPAVAGAVYTAALGTTLPTTANASLGASFTCLGYVSEDGLKNTNSPTSTNIKAWGGDIVATPMTEKADEFKLKLIEALNADVLKAVYGRANVSGALATGITVAANAKEAEALVWVFDTIMANGALKRIVIPNGKITAVGDIVYKDNEVIGYDITIAAMPGSDGDTHKEYIKSASTT